MATTEQRNADMRNITKEFTDEPLSIMFQRPVESDKKTTPEYHTRIKKPMDLSTVKKNIKDNKYSCYQEWIDDMNLIWDNAVEYNTAESVIGGVAIYLKKKFQKRIMMLDASNLRNYEAHLVKLTKDIQNILSNPPQSFNVQQQTNWCDKVGPFSLDRIQKIMDGVGKLDEQGKTDEILEIISTYEHDFVPSPDATIDFGVLGRRTLLALEEYLDKNLPK